MSSSDSDSSFHWGLLIFNHLIMAMDMSLYKDTYIYWRWTVEQGSSFLIPLDLFGHFGWMSEFKCLNMFTAWMGWNVSPAGIKNWTYV